jgi:site-specific DNA-methyltransferase (cytosine-N4-specific)
VNPHYQDEAVTLYHGDALEVLQGLPDASVDCCVTSPPYFGLRDYGEAGQYGLEASPAAYVETMRAVFAEVRRVLTDDGTLWLNIGDTYSAKRTYQVDQTKVQASGKSQPFDTLDDRPAKNLLGIPWRTAFALQDDGWILRNDVIWAKPNAMPESVTDRLSTRHEHLFMLAKSRRYWFDLDPIREERVRSDRSDVVENVSKLDGLRSRPDNAQSVFTTGQYVSDGRNPGDVWTVTTQPFSEAHFAVMPQALAERAIQAGCKPAGVVLDPFSGSGTTGLAAAKHGRRYVGIDLSSDYLELSLRTRLGQKALL